MSVTARTFHSAVKAKEPPREGPDLPRRGELLALLFDHIADAIFLVELDGRIVDANPAATSMLGYTREELLQMHPWDIVTSASPEEIEALMHGLERNVPVTVQRICRGKSGGEGTMELRLTRFGCADRDLIVASCRDLTEQKRLEERVRDLTERHRVEEELRRLNAELSAQTTHLRELNQSLLDSEQRLRLAIETGRIGLWVWNSTDVANAGDWSERLKEIFGLPLDAQVTHEMFLQCVHPDDRNGVDRAVMQALSGVNGGEYAAEYRTIHPRDASERWVTARGQAFFDSEGQPIRFIGTVMDVTERKRAEEASLRVTHELEERVRERTASLLRTQRLSQTGSAAWNVVTGEVVWSEETYRIFGLEPGSAVTLEVVMARIHPEDFPRIRERFIGASDELHFAHRLSMPDGRIKYLQVAATAVRNDAGQLKEWVGAVRDVTEIRRGEDYLRLVIDTIPGLVWSSLPDGYIEYLNKQWLDYTGLTLEQARGWGWQAAIHPDDLSKLLTYWKSMLTEAREGETEARLRRFDGEYRWFLFRGVPLRDANGQLAKWYGTNTDVEAMRASERLARGQVDALTQTLNALSHESAPEKFLEHVLRTIIGQLDAHSISVWEMNERSGSVQLVGNCEGNQLQLTSSDQKPAAPAIVSAPREHPVWSEFFRTGAHCVIGEIRAGEAWVRMADGPGTEWHHWMGDAVADPNASAMMNRLAALGILSTLCVPLVVDGKVTGFLSIRFQHERLFRGEEIELARALAHQATLAFQLMRLSQLSREAAVAAERNRLARDIHDTLAQGFTGIIVQLEAAEDARARGLAAEASGHVLRASELARGSLQEARRSVHALRPPALQQKDLCSAMMELVEEATKGTGVRAEFSVRGQPPPLPGHWEENLLRIVQEALTNTLRHARARSFQVHLVFTGRAVQLDLIDDGCGFDVPAHPEGFGLLGMKERIDEMGGELTMQSAPGRGTALGIALPFPQADRVSS